MDAASAAALLRGVSGNEEVEEADVSGRGRPAAAATAAAGSAPGKDDEDGNDDDDDAGTDACRACPITKSRSSDHARDTTDGLDDAFALDGAELAAAAT